MSVNDEPHFAFLSFGGNQHRMINLLRGVFQSRPDILQLKIRKIGENLGLGRPGGEHVDHIFNADAHPQNAWAPAALTGVKSDSIHVFRLH